MYPGVGTFVLIRPTQTFYERIKIVPVSAGGTYNKSIVGSELAMFEGCGHRPEIEKSQEFIDWVQSFLA